MNNKITFPFEIKYEVNTPEKRGVFTATRFGTDGPDACDRYAKDHPGHAVIAWRAIPLQNKDKEKP